MLMKNSKWIIGVKQSVKTLKNLKNTNNVKLHVAKDADEKVVKLLLELAEDKRLDIIYIDTMKELGEMFNIDVGAAAALILEEVI